MEINKHVFIFCTSVSLRRRFFFATQFCDRRGVVVKKFLLRRFVGGGGISQRAYWQNQEPFSQCGGSFDGLLIRRNPNLPPEDEPRTAIWLNLALFLQKISLAHHPPATRRSGIYTSQEKGWLHSSTIKIVTMALELLLMVLLGHLLIGLHKIHLGFAIPSAIMKLF